MNFCTECGYKVDNNSSFCTSCGSSLNQSSQQELPTNKPKSPQTRATPKAKKTLSKTSKLTIASLISLIVVIFGAYKGLEAYYDPSKDLQAMDEAIAANDEASFFSMIELDSSAAIDEISYFQYIKENEWNAIKDQYLALLEEESHIGSNLSREFQSVYGGKLFTVKPEKELFGLFTSYNLRAEPEQLTVVSSMNDAKITFNGAESTIDADEPSSIATIYPGEYTIAGEVQSMFGDFQHEQEFTTYPNEEQEIYMNFDGNVYGIDTNQPSAELFVNGESTGKTLEEFDELGPFPTEEEVELHAELQTENGDVISSDTITQNDPGGWFGLPFYFDQETALDESTTEEDEIDQTSDENAVENDQLDQVSEHILAFRDNYEDTVNNKDFSQVENMLDYNSDAYEEIKTYVDDLEDSAYSYEFTENEIISTEEISEGVYEVTTNERFIFTNHLNVQTDYDRMKSYTVIEDGDFYITEIDYLETQRD
ncbi:TcaA 3rd/4th domain-containing protein [Halalkalibacillus halophilus]|uniref:TcaA 3rd/4th domain-containing protein n=1 Tax=Halalkalibacillus halophilus TaxID=392827 RepID=UPI0003FF0FBD|nr:zinc-ribbon domain-containing protein [Halalkalibacillus halophilus]